MNLAAVAAVVGGDPAVHMDSMAEAASEDFASLPSDCLPNCSLPREEAVQDREAEGSASVHPIGDQEAHLLGRQADRLVGGRLGGGAHLPG